MVVVVVAVGGTLPEVVSKLVIFGGFSNGDDVLAGVAGVVVGVGFITVGVVIFVLALTFPALLVVSYIFEGC